MQAQPVGGGSLLGAGRMWVAQTAEADPRAVKVWLEGHDLPAESLVKRYLPEVWPHLCLLYVQLGEVGSSGRWSGHFANRCHCVQLKLSAIRLPKLNASGIKLMQCRPASWS